MGRSTVRGLTLVALVALAAGSARPLYGQPSGAPSPADQEAARKLIEQGRDFQRLLGEKERDFLAGKVRDPMPGERVYFTKAEYAIPKESLEKPRGLDARRSMVVTYYRYKTDEAIRSVVDLQSRKVLKVERVAHLPTPLAKEEVEEAEDRARNNDEVHKLIDRYGKERVEFSALVPAVGEKDPAFGHRLVDLSIRVGKDYLVSPRVRVDLTTGKVQVKAIALPAAMKMER